VCRRTPWSRNLRARRSAAGQQCLGARWRPAGDGDFYRHEHKLIYEAIGKLINASKPADVITVYEHLQGMGKAEEIGGLMYLNQLAQYVPSASNIRRYAEIVRERAICASWSPPATTSPPMPSIRRARRRAHPRRGRAEDHGDRREGARNKQGFQSLDTLVVDLLDRSRRWPTTPWTSPACPQALSIWTA
jgi:replicative DNA helicase